MSARSDRISLLQTFVRIVERGSLSAAARDLGISQPSVSRQLAALEDMMGTVLLTRTTHALAPTADGSALMVDARRILADWETLTERLHRGGRVQGALRVVVPVALGQRSLMAAAIAFLQEHPQVMIDWRLTDGPVHFAREGCDIWVKVGPVPDETLVVRKVGEVERLVVASPALATSFKNAPLADVPFAALEPFEGDQIALFDRDGRKVGIRTAPRLTTDSIEALLSAVLAGLGAAIMPRWLIASDLAAGQLVDIAPSLRAARLPVHLAMTSGARRPERVERFAAAVSSWAASTL